MKIVMSIVLLFIMSSCSDIYEYHAEGYLQGHTKHIQNKVFGIIVYEQWLLCSTSRDDSSNSKSSIIDKWNKLPRH